MSADTALEVGRLYGQIKRIADVLTSSQEDLFIKLPALEAYFPMSLVGLGGIARNHGGGADLQMTGTAPAGYDGNSFRQLGNGVNYLGVTDGAFNLTGLETYVEASLRGFTIGGWFNIGSLAPTFSGLISKDADVPNRGYSFAVRDSGLVRLQVSLAGGTPIFEETSAVVAVGQWHFLVGRFTPSNEIAVFVGILYLL